MIIITMIIITMIIIYFKNNTPRKYKTTEIVHVNMKYASIKLPSTFSRTLGAGLGLLVVDSGTFVRAFSQLSLNKE